MAEAAVNGTSLYYETVGHGPPCLVLHGGLGLDHSYLRGLDALGRDESLADDPVPPAPVEVEVLQRVPPATDEEWAATMAALAPFWFRHPERFEPASLFAGTIFNAQAVAHSMWALASW